MGQSFSTTNYKLQYSMLGENIQNNTTSCLQKFTDMFPTENFLFINNNVQYIYKEDIIDSPRWLYINGSIEDSMDVYCGIYYINESKLLQNGIIFDNFNQLSKFILKQKSTPQTNNIINYQTNINTMYMNQLV